jgi:stage V sporulation protein SpoVS
MAVVTDLGARGASGVLEVRGNPSGAIYLDRGHIAFARASWVPGLVARLRGILPSPAVRQDLLAGRDIDGAGGIDDIGDTAVAALAVRRGYLTPAGLHELIGSIVVDAFLVLTIPLAADSTVASIRFASARTYLTEMFPRLDIDPVRGEALRRARRMADYGLAPTTAVALRDLRRPAAVLTSQQWAVASLIIGTASAREIALRRGTALADTVECLGGLIRAGLCTPVRVAERRQPPSLPPGQVRSAGQAPTVDLLRQVLNGLRRLS